MDGEWRDNGVLREGTVHTRFPLRPLPTSEYTFVCMYVCVCSRQNTFICIYMYMDMDIRILCI